MNAYAKYKKNRKRANIIEREVSEFKCSATAKTVLIVPFRESNPLTKERMNQLCTFAEHYHKFIPNLEILIIEQSNDNKKFNRGALLNIGFDLSKSSSGNVFIFHDVDLLSPDSISDLYCSYPKNPIHIANLWTEKYTFTDFLGGIISFNKKDFIRINGFPNDFWGWGGEDDAVYNRIASANIPIVKVIGDVKIKGLEHTHQGDNISTKNVNKTTGILRDLKSWRRNGLNNVKYRILNVKNFRYRNIQKVTVELLG